MVYRLGTTLPVEEVSDGFNLLISGPPMTGKYELLLGVLLSSCDNVVVVSTKNSAERIREDVDDIATDGVELGVVDTVSRQRNIETLSGDALTKYVSSPENLTQMGVKFTVLFDHFYENQPEERTGVGIHSVSHLLMYSDVKAVYQFLQVITGKIQSAEWLGVATLDSTVHDEQTKNMLQNHFDGVVETRRVDGERQLRVVGLGSEATDWSRF
jgi:KaiC/GvpD/RAD55 family RecA-like ATPase